MSLPGFDAAGDRVRSLSETKRLALRRLLADQNAEARLLELEGSNLRQLRTGTGANLFVFPATDGSVGYMTGYLPHIPKDWNVFGCQTPGLDGEREPSTSVEEIAAHTVRQIRRVQPASPYHLAGNCMGGLPAFEAAHQLRAAGAEVGTVLHLMPTFQRSWKGLPTLDSLPTRALIDYGFIMERLLGEPVHLPLDAIAAADEADRTDLAIDVLIRHPGLAGVTAQTLRHRIEVYQANLQAMFTYRPDSDPDSTLTVIAVGEEERDEDMIDLESPYAAALRAVPPDRLRVQRVNAEAGSLFDCAEPHMSKIGAVLRDVLSNTLGEGRA
ncbi:thioesterase domain-containing protein [Streptomyces sp. NPDC127068]|uniref:thioesterase domain-containing protein n=1 Tax=Streptomyces sp. NPDC127068 TaxID=3347127 RepID=UPI003654D28F